MEEIFKSERYNLEHPSGLSDISWTGPPKIKQRARDLRRGEDADRKDRDLVCLFAEDVWPETRCWLSVR